MENGENKGFGLCWLLGHLGKGMKVFSSVGVSVFQWLLIVSGRS